jgi:hypothetical protein
MFNYKIKKLFCLISFFFNITLLYIILSNFNHKNENNKSFNEFILQTHCNDESLFELNRKINQVLNFKIEYWNYSSNLVLFKMKNDILELDENEISILLDMNK